MTVAVRVIAVPLATVVPSGDPPALAVIEVRVRAGVVAYAAPGEIASRT